MGVYHVNHVIVEGTLCSATRVSFRGGGGGGGGSFPLGTFLPPLEIVFFKCILDVDKCLTKCMSSESMHM